jgi:hypothetical protein
MATRISDALEVSHAKLNAQGAFDAFTDIDSHFHIHPALLAATGTKELSTSANRIKKHFTDVIVLLDASKNETDVFFRRAWNKLIFPEISLAGLGYSKDDTHGRAIGPKLAKQITDTAFQIVKAGIKDPEIFELVGLFEEDVGSDLISDMCLQLILPDILTFNERVVKTLKLKTIQAKIATSTYLLPVNLQTNKPILLIPEEILSPLPVATCWEDIDTVCSYNEDVRNHINKNIGRTWGDARNKIHKGDIKRALLHNPELLKDLIEQYKNKPPEKYDYSNDPLGEIIWFEVSQTYAKQFPLKLADVDTGNHSQVIETVSKICKQFKKLVEDNGLSKLFYNQNKKLKPERAAQLLFYGVADAYCAANDIDLSREPDAGRGPVDFKASKGYKSRVNVEVKYTTNKQLVHGYEMQLPVYNKAEQSFHSIYLIVQTNNSMLPIKKVEKLRNQALAEGKKAPEVIVVDGRIYPSASLI